MVRSQRSRLDCGGQQRARHSGREHPKPAEPETYVRLQQQARGRSARSARRRLRQHFRVANRVQPRRRSERQLRRRRSQRFRLVHLVEQRLRRGRVAESDLAPRDVHAGVLAGGGRIPVRSPLAGDGARLQRDLSQPGERNHGGQLLRQLVRERERKLVQQQRRPLRRDPVVLAQRSRSQPQPADRADRQQLLRRESQVGGEADASGERRSGH